MTTFGTHNKKANVFSVFYTNFLGYIFTALVPLPRPPPLKIFLTNENPFGNGQAVRKPNIEFPPGNSNVSTVPVLSNQSHCSLVSVPLRGKGVFPLSATPSLNFLV